MQRGGLEQVLEQDDAVGGARLGQAFEVGLGSRNCVRQAEAWPGCDLSVPAPDRVVEILGGIVVAVLDHRASGVGLVIG